VESLQEAMTPGVEGVQGTTRCGGLGVSIVWILGSKRSKGRRKVKEESNSIGET
jgi:hypothetical protein